MIKKIFPISIFLLILIAILSSCNSSNGYPNETNCVVIDKRQNCQYVIIYGKDASNTVVQQASLLCSELKKKYGVEIYTQSDWDYRPNDSLENHGSDHLVEILIGTTTRTDSINTHNSFTSKNEYVVEAVNNSLVFAATSEQLLIDAIDKFKSEYLNNQFHNISLPNGIIIRNSDYEFFDIAKNGHSNCTIVIPENASSRVVTLANALANRINNSCDTGIKAVTEDKITSFENCILIGDLNHPDSQSTNDGLSQGQSIVTLKESNLIIAGYDDTALINGICNFIGNVVMKHDYSSDKTPYLYFPKNLVLEDVCSLVVPNVPGGTLDKSNCDSTNLFTLNYSDIDYNEFTNYIETLKSMNFIVNTNKNTNDNNIVSMSATYNYTDASITINSSINISYNKQTNQLNMSISCFSNSIK